MFCGNDNYNNKEAEAPMANGIRKLGPAGRVSLALVCGLAIGVAISVFGTEKLKSDAAGIEFIGTLWINGIRMTVIPLIISLLVTTVSSFADLKSAGRNGGRLLLLFVGLWRARLWSPYSWYRRFSLGSRGVVMG